jgi:hypothetical protein
MNDKQRKISSFLKKKSNKKNSAESSDEDEYGAFKQPASLAEFAQKNLQVPEFVKEEAVKPKTDIWSIAFQTAVLNTDDYGSISGPEVVKKESVILSENDSKDAKKESLSENGLKDVKNEPVILSENEAKEEVEESLQKQQKEVLDQPPITYYGIKRKMWKSRVSMQFIL